MPEIVPTPLPTSAMRLCAIVRLIAVVVGLCVGGSNLIAWLLDPSSIVARWPGITLMRINTAIAITAAALSLALWPQGDTRGWRVLLAKALGIVVATIGGLTASQDLTGVDIGIDRITGVVTFPGDHGNKFTNHAGRMSLNAALSLFFLGMALAGLNRAARWLREDFHPSAAFALIASLPAAMALVGHLLGVGNLTGLLHSTNILLHTATALFVLSIGVLAAQPDRAPVRRILARSAEGILLRMLLPGSAALLIGLGWLISRGREAKIVAAGEGTAVMLYGGLLLLYLLLMAAGRAVQRQADTAERASAALRAGQERSRAILETALDGVILMDSAGVVIDWNPAAERIFGWKRDEAVGQTLANLIIPEPLRAAHARGLARYAESGGRSAPILRKRLDFNAVRRDGSEFPVEVVVNALDDAPPVVFVGFIRDITERKAAEQSLRAAKDAAEKASRAKDDFLAALSHELRNPLAPVLLSATALREDSRLPGDVRDELAMMQRNVSLEARIIDDLLDLTRIARGRLPLRAEHCDVHSLLAYAVEIVREEAAAKKLNVELQLNAAHPGLAGDAARLQQLFWNLLRNAVKFTPAGGSIAIRTRNEKDELVIEVCDSGIGFEPGRVEQLFEPFAQGGLENDHRFGGLGLGLAIARAIVNMHHGSIHAASEGPGRGAIFFVKLPDAMSAPAKIRQDGPPIDEPPVVPLRLLLVEDHEATLATLTRLLKHAGHRVTTASNVAAGVAAGLAEKFDIVLTDLGLPDGTGIDLLGKLRATQPGLKAIALSGYGMEQDLAKSRAAGFARHLVKPVDFTQLRRALLDVMAD